MNESKIRKYAVKLIVDGATSHAEDDLNEDGELTDEEHEQAVEFALATLKTFQKFTDVFEAAAKEAG